MNLEVIDNIVPSELIKKYNDLNISWTRNRSDDEDVVYNTCDEYGRRYHERDPSNLQAPFLNKWTHPEALDMWTWFSKAANLTINNLDSCYVNSLSYGDEGYAHIDATEKYQSVTCIIYLNTAWHSQWGGETVFYSGEYTEDFADDWYYEHDIIKSILPRYRRMILFEATIPHSVRPLSRKCGMQRNTFMFKLVSSDFNTIKKGLLDATT